MAKTVIASAAREIEMLHFWRVRKRSAEMSDPAWAMETQKMKFVMSQAQKQGLLEPQTPTPVTIM